MKAGKDNKLLKSEKNDGKSWNTMTKMDGKRGKKATKKASSGEP